MIKIFAVAAAAALIAAPAFAQDNSMGTGMSTSSTTTTAKPMKHKMHKKHVKKSSMSNSMGNNTM